VVRDRDRDRDRDRAAVAPGPSTPFTWSSANPKLPCKYLNARSRSFSPERAGRPVAQLTGLRPSPTVACRRSAVLRDATVTVTVTVTAHADRALVPRANDANSERGAVVPRQSPSARAAVGAHPPNCCQNAARSDRIGAQVHRSCRFLASLDGMGWDAADRPSLEYSRRLGAARRSASSLERAGVSSAGESCRGGVALPPFVVRGRAP